MCSCASLCEMSLSRPPMDSIIFSTRTARSSPDFPQARFPGAVLHGILITKQLHLGSLPSWWEQNCSFSVWLILSIRLLVTFIPQRSSWERVPKYTEWLPTMTSYLSAYVHVHCSVVVELSPDPPPGILGCSIQMHTHISSLYPHLLLTSSGWYLS